MGGEIKPDISNAKFIKDEAYLDSVIEKRIHLFESIKAQQNEARQRIGGETIRYLRFDKDRSKHYSILSNR